MPDPSAYPTGVAPLPRRPGACPLNHGLFVVDQLLAAITREGDRDELDAALDFRLILAQTNDPAGILRGYFALRGVVEERHYLALYRLRRWLENQFAAVVHLDRSSPPHQVGLKLNAASFGALYAQCAVTASLGQPPQAWTRVQFVPVLVEGSAAHGSRASLPIG